MANLEEYVLLFTKRSGRTRKSIAKAIGYQSPQTLNAHISSPSKLTIDDAVALAETMGISLDEVCRLAMSVQPH